MASDAPRWLRRLLIGLLMLMGSLTALLCTRPDVVHRLGGPRETLDPCRSPLAWHIRSADPRFGFTEDELHRAVTEAAEVWNRAASSRLFRHDTAGSMAIDLVYDERQRALETRRDHQARLDSLRSEVAALQSMMERARLRAESAREAYEHDPSPTTAATYRARVDRFNELVDQYNRAADRYNRAVEAALADDAVAPSVAQAGDLRAQTRLLGDRLVSIDRVLTVFVAGDYEELVLVLAHELGHALGLDHVAAPNALMAEQYRREDITLPLALTEADRRALVEVCEDGV